eukprot:1160185-Pelagomonas_calceolata.AAC.7
MDDETPYFKTSIKMGWLPVFHHSMSFAGVSNATPLRPNTTTPGIPPSHKIEINYSLNLSQRESCRPSNAPPQGQRWPGTSADQPGSPAGVCRDDIVACCQDPSGFVLQAAVLDVLLRHLGDASSWWCVPWSAEPGIALAFAWAGRNALGLR